MPAFPRLAAALLTLTAAPALHAQQDALTPRELATVERLTDPQASPDGRFVAFVLREADLEENTGRTDLWLLDLSEADPQPRRITHHPGNDSSPRWSPDSRAIYFLSTRSGSNQVWRLPLAGGEAMQVTDYPLDIGSLKVSPSGGHLAVTMEILPGCESLQCTRERIAEQAESQASGRIHEQLFVRHWDTWDTGTRSHLFAAPLRPDGTAGEPEDLSGALDANVPSRPFGGDADFAFSPDGKRLVFSARLADRTEPWSTNFDLYEVPVDGSAPPRNLTAANRAWDAQPVFLPNGDLAWLAMERPGFEADRFQVMLRDARSGATRSLTRGWDRSAGDLGLAPGGQRLLATADDLGQHALFAIDLQGGDTPRRIVGTGQVTGYAVAGDTIVYAWSTLALPPDLYAVGAAGGEPRRLTSVNRELLAQNALGEFEQFSFAGWNDETVYGYVVKPYGFRPGRKYPIAFIVHGGPQVSFQNQWNYRWNAQTFAGAGYAVVLIDFHGSPGYGQAFTDSISGDWGGKPLVDLQKGLAAAIARYDWLDGDRACALGASYGGYMMNWIAGNWPQRFRCLVNHAGIFDQRMMYYTTEELWFPEWEHGGPYFERPEAYEKFNPANYVTAWRTPMLVTHGALDFRVPYTQGLATFTALQRRGIESRLLYFPDENHWVLKPANSILWYETVLEWLGEHLQE